MGEPQTGLASTGPDIRESPSANYDQHPKLVFVLCVVTLSENYLRGGVIMVLVQITYQILGKWLSSKGARYLVCTPETHFSQQISRSLVYFW